MRACAVASATLFGGASVSWEPYAPWRPTLHRERAPLGRIEDRSRSTTSELVADCQEGDALAWRELVTRYRRLVFGVARACGLQVSDAEDVFQQTFAELARSLGRLREPERLEAWLCTTARRAAIRLKSSETRRARSLADPSLELAPASPEAFEERLDRLRMAERVRRELEALGPPCSTLLLGLFASPPRPYRELARQAGLAVGSLGATRARCLERLRRRLRVALRGVTVAPTAGKETRT